MISRHFAGHRVLAAALLMASCSSNSGGGGPAPVIASFTADAAIVAPGNSTTLRWSVTNATSLSIDHGVGPVSGASVVVTPVDTTTYTLTVTNAAGTSLTRIMTQSIFLSIKSLPFTCTVFLFVPDLSFPFILAQLS